MRILALFGFISLYSAWAAPCYTAWASTNGAGFQAGAKVSFNSENFVAKNWVSDATSPNLDATNWTNEGACTGGATSSIAVSSSSIVSSSNAASSVLNSSVVAASSAIQTSSSADVLISYAKNDAKDDVIQDRESTKRCDIIGQTDTTSNNVQKCLDPATLNGALMKVPGNVTRLSKNGLSVCQIVQGETKPTAIVFIMDHSGSMGWNDPLKIADDAFEQALDKLKALDAGAHAGYLPFSGSSPTDGIIISDSVHLGALDVTHLNNLKTKMNDTYSGGTYPSSSLAEAEAWLANAKYDNFNKAIVFLADGGPSDGPQSLAVAQKVGYPATHSIFMNSGNEPAAEKFMRDVADATTGGSYTKITTAAELDPVIQKIIKNLVQTFTPNAVSMVNSDLGVTGRSDLKALTIQSDSSWKMPMDQDVPLQPGLNNMILSTEYKLTDGSISKKDIAFQIELVNQVFNDDQDLNGTVFATSCVDWNKIELQDEQSVAIDHFKQQHQKFKLFFQSVIEGGLGDTTNVTLYSKHYKDTLSIKVPLQKVDGIKYQYWIDVPITWNKDAIVTNSSIELYPVDSIYASWKHPSDSRDDAFKKVVVFWEHAKPQTLELFDVDGNGKMDSLSLSFNEEVRPFTLDYMTYSFLWPNATDSVIDLKGLLFQKSTDSSKLHVLFHADSVGYQTGLDSTFGKFVVVQDNPEESPLPDTTFASVVVKDVMAPVLYKARIGLGKKEQEGLDSLQLHVSESLDSTTNFSSGTEFVFVTNPGRQDGLFVMDKISWNKKNQLAHVLFGKTVQKEFSFFPYDSIRFVPQSISDKAGNLSRADHKWIEIDVALRQEVAVNNMAVIESSSLQELPSHTFTPYGIEADLKGSTELKNHIAIAIGPLKKNALGPDEKYEDIQWNWSIRIFDHFGQYINKFSGVIECDDEAFTQFGGGDCIEGEGVQFLWKWNYKTELNQVVGTGVYLLEINITGQETFIQKVGVRREE